MERDLAAERPERAARLAAKCEASFVDASDAATAVVDVPQDLREALGELGYLETPAQERSAAEEQP